MATCVQDNTPLFFFFSICDLCDLGKLMRPCAQGFGIFM